jgi:tetratricopeptide (TPR) repeat protein
VDISVAGPIYYKLSQSYHQAGIYERAEAAQRKSLDFCPHQSLYHLSLSDILAVQGKFGDARAACEKAVDLNPAQAGVYYNRLGNTLLRAGFHQQAVDVFLQALAAEPANPFYYIHAAECYQALGFKDKAEQCLRKAGARRERINSAPSSSALP